MSELYEFIDSAFGSVYTYYSFRVDYVRMQLGVDHPRFNASISYTSLITVDSVLEENLFRAYMLSN